MPTAARLVAALILAAVGWLAADLVKPYLPEGRPVGLFSPVAAGFGLIVGWSFTGRRLEQKTGGAVGIGLASAALQVFWVLVAFSGYEMLLRSLRRSYDGPTEALQGMVEIGVDYLVTAAKPEVIGVMLLGGLVAGAVTTWVAGRFR